MKLAFLIGAGRFPAGILQERRAQRPQAFDVFAAGEKPKSVLNAPANPRRLLRCESARNV